MVFAFPEWRTGASTGQVAGEYTEGAARLIPLITEIGQIICCQVRGIEEKPVELDENGIAPMYLTKQEYETLAATTELETV